jgi:hypothetical protein
VDMIIRVHSLGPPVGGFSNIPYAPVRCVDK